jgi:thioredoxin-related protein
MFRAIILGLAALLALAGPAWGETARGRMVGGERYALPDWFKASFLDIKEDIAEATQQGKHLMLFMHLEECPYCARMLRENFVSGERRDRIQKHFDVVGVDFRGGREVTWVDGKTYSERRLVAMLKVFGTPSIIVFDADGGKALHLTGYRDPQAFGLALDYVQQQRYRSQSLAAFLEAQARPKVWKLRPHPRFAERNDLAGHAGPLAVVFEDAQCGECAAFHERVLNHPEVLAEMQNFLVVRFDTDAKAPLVAPAGRSTTAGEWARSLGLSYRPAVVLYDEGREIMRIDARLYHFHFSERLRYVGGRFYKQYPGYGAYSAARREELLRQGRTIDYAD